MVSRRYEKPDRIRRVAGCHDEANCAGSAVSSGTVAVLLRRDDYAGQPAPRILGRDVRCRGRGQPAGPLFAIVRSLGIRRSSHLWSSGLLGHHIFRTPFAGRDIELRADVCPCTWNGLLAAATRNGGDRRGRLFIDRRRTSSGLVVGAGESTKWN